MNANSSSRITLLKAALLFMGASFFAFCLCLFVHEIGHYLSFTILGIPSGGIVLNPFGGNYAIRLGEYGTPWRRALFGFSGPFLTVLIGVMVSLLLWRRRAPVLLPLLMVGSTSLLTESVGMILDITDASGDWAKVMQIGIPAGILWLLAVVMLIAGCIWMLQLLPLTGIRSQDALWRKLVVYLAGFPVFFLCAVIYQTLFGGDYYIPGRGGPLLMEDLRKAKSIQLGASIVLTIMVTALHKPLFPWLDRLSHTPVGQVRWRDTLIAIGLGAAIVIIQLVFFNDPTAQVIP
jgi:hypothetical protein